VKEVEVTEETETVKEIVTEVTIEPKWQTRKK